jgi:tRNA(adenine34) deaminase
MKLALEQAEIAASKGEIPVGAVLVDEAGQILSLTSNMPLRYCDPTAHAEILALREGAKKIGNYRLTDTTLYVTIEPCSMCAGALVLARVKRLVYGAEDPKAGACGTLYNIVQDLRLNHYVEISHGVLAEECRSLIRTFFKKRR